MHGDRVVTVVGHIYIYTHILQVLVRRMLPMRMTSLYYTTR